MSGAAKAFAVAEVFPQFRAWMDDPDLCILAAHTSDLDGYVTEIAACDRHGLEIHSERVRLVHGEINPAAARISGLTADALACARPFRAVWDELRPVFVSRPCVAYSPEWLGAAISRTMGFSLDPRPDSPPDVFQQFAEVAAFRQFRASDVTNAYAYVSGKRTRNHSQPFAFRPLKTALAECGVPDDDFGCSALSNARRVARLIQAVSALNEFEERFVHLHEAAPAPVSEEVPF